MKRGAAQQKWDSANMTTLSCRVTKEKAEAFRKKCEAAGTKPNAVLLECVNGYLNGRTKEIEVSFTDWDLADRVSRMNVLPGTSPESQYRQAVTRIFSDAIAEKIVDENWPVLVGPDADLQQSYKTRFKYILPNW